MGIGNRIRELRVRQGITREILAQKIGVTASAVGNYECEVSFPKEPVLMKLFGALNCTPNELLGENTPFAERERALLDMYTALDEQGKERVDECARGELRRVRAESGEFEEVPIAARGGSDELIRLKKRKDKSIRELPDYKGGRR